jgi:hypothetical protein
VLGFKKNTREFSFILSLRVEFLLKTDSGYPKYAGVGTPWSTLGIPSAITPLGLESRVFIEN